MIKTRKKSLLVYIVSTTVNSFFQLGFLFYLLYTPERSLAWMLLFGCMSGSLLLVEAISSMVFAYRNPLFVEEGKSFRVTDPRKAMMSLGFGIPSLLNSIVFMSFVSFVIPVEGRAVISNQVLEAYWTIELLWRSMMLGVALGSVVWLVRLYRSDSE